MKFERQTRRRLTEPGSKARKHLDVAVPDLKAGQGTLLPSGEIILNHPEQGLLLLRADYVHVYTPVKESSDPLDSILGKPPVATTPKEEPVVLASEDDAAEDEDEPLIGLADLGANKKETDDPGSITGGAGFGNKY